MLGFVAGLFAVSKSPSVTMREPISRRAKLGVEMLRDREVPQASRFFSPSRQSTRPVSCYHAALAIKVPEFTGVTFHLTASDGRMQELTITSETHLPDGSATFTATWTGTDAIQQVFKSRLQFDGRGNVAISFSWIPVADAMGSFYGTITLNSGYSSSGGSKYGDRYHLNGDSYACGSPKSEGMPAPHYEGNGGVPKPVIIEMREVCTVAG